MFELVSREAAGKRSTARIASLGVNGAGLVVMIAVFAHTGGLTGAEVAVAGGTSAVGQRVLEAMLGDQAVRTLAERAREDLLLGARAGCWRPRPSATTPCSRARRPGAARPRGAARRGRRARAGAVSAPLESRLEALADGGRAGRRAARARGRRAGARRSSAGPASGSGTGSRRRWSRWRARPAPASPRCSTRWQGGRSSGRACTRPTTSAATAAIWGPPDGRLLDWLEVPSRHTLDGGAPDGLVVLDLPDFDSVESAHRLEVDRLVGLVDLLVWVVDPQKYADAALHDRYLRPLAGHAAAMLVVLNQSDRLGADAPRAREDLARLLEAGGLGVGARARRLRAHGRGARGAARRAGGSRRAARGGARPAGRGRRRGGRRADGGHGRRRGVGPAPR